MAKYADIAFKGSVDNIRNLTQQAFAFNGFQISWENQLKTGPKGKQRSKHSSRVLAQHYAVDFEIFASDQGGTLRLVKSGSGMAGGLLGMRKVNKQFDLLSDTLASWFTHQGLLIGVRKD